MATPYATQADLYAFGLPRGAAPNPGRLAQVDASLDAFTVDAHGFDANSPVTFRADAGGALPTLIAANTTYYAIPLSDNLLQVAAAEDGAAIALDAGSNVLVIAPLPVAQAIDWASRLCDDMLPAHVVPFAADAVPDIVRMTVAELAAFKLLKAGSSSNAIMAMVDMAMSRLKRWAQGVPVRGAGNPANLSVAATAAPSDASGWKTYGGL